MQSVRGLDHPVLWGGYTSNLAEHVPAIRGRQARCQLVSSMMHTMRHIQSESYFFAVVQAHVEAVNEFRASQDPLVRSAVAVLRHAILEQVYRVDGAPGLVLAMRMLFGHLLGPCTPDCDILRSFELAVPCAADNDESTMLRCALRTLHDEQDATMLHKLCLVIPDRGWMASAAYLRGRLNTKSATLLDQMHEKDKFRALVDAFSQQPSVAVNVAVAVLSSMLAESRDGFVTNMPA